MSFDLPADSIIPLRDLKIVLDEGPHPFELQNLPAIEEFWAKTAAANPALFDGRVALLARLSLRDGVLDGRCHLVRYATFLYWRSLRPIPHAGHTYASAMLVSSDNALIAARMGLKTANPGRVYFASGTFDTSDFRDGYVDPLANMHREVKEETGLELDGAPREPRYHLLSKVSGTVLFRRYFLDRTAEEIEEAIRDHVASEEEPEIEGPVVIRSADDVPTNMADHMHELVRWHFATPADVSSLVT